MGDSPIWPCVTILDRIEEILATFDSSVDLARQAMRRYGNMSSGTVVFILDALLNSTPRTRPGAHDELRAGLQAHQVLIRVGAG